VSALELASGLLALPILLPAGYLFALTLLSRRPRAPGPVPPRLRFEVVVPAHDEEAGIGQTVASLSAVDYPQAQRRITVVADNCTDQTAQRASAAGARVLERTDAARRGKGYALAFAFERVLAEGWADAVVVIDADSVASPNLLSAFGVRLEHGARAVQAHYGVRNAAESWRTRLMAIAFSLFHVVRSVARERRGLSCGLRGNGMCFASNVLSQVPHDAFSIVEDVEYGLRLGEAGIRVHYAGEAHVLGEMVSGERAARSQRQRWEGGRLALARRRGLPLLARAIARRDAVLFDLAWDLFVPPLSWLSLGASLGTTFAVGAAVWGGAPGACLPWALVWAFLGIHVLRGWYVSGVGPRGFFDLLRVPVYMVWKLTLPLRRGKPPAAAWVRTARPGEASSWKALD
jgi:1,2-diacylglycerol 3-beta-glucosyltransferase